MYIHDVIASLRDRDARLAKELRSIMHILAIMEKYLAEVSDYPAGPVSRETCNCTHPKEVHDDGQPTLF